MKKNHLDKWVRKLEEIIMIFPKAVEKQQISWVMYLESILWRLQMKNSGWRMFTIQVLRTRSGVNLWRRDIVDWMSIIILFLISRIYLLINNSFKGKLSELTYKKKFNWAVNNKKYLLFNIFTLFFILDISVILSY